ncbi:MAG: hypothetical protein P8Z36_06245, partial [Gemmatimonadota bacterium]
MLDRHLLRTYLRQRLELGEHEVFLDHMTAAEALRLLRPATDDRRPPSGPGEAGSALLRAETGEAASGVAAPVAGRRSGGAVDSEVPVAPKELVVLGERAAVCTRCRLHE